jgi:hypothetical protein
MKFYNPSELVKSIWNRHGIIFAENESIAKVSVINRLIEGQWLYLYSITGLDYPCVYSFSSLILFRPLSLTNGDYSSVSDPYRLISPAAGSSGANTR